MSAFGNCEDVMDYSQLKRFAAAARSGLMSGNDEETAYYGFMRLCALAFVSYDSIREIMEEPQELRSAAFKEKCRQLSAVYGGIFLQHSELPVPEQLFDEDGAAARLTALPREIFRMEGALGWAHQGFNSPYREEIAVGLKNSKRLEAEKIAAATQLFTPMWIVRYMVQNTLCRYLEAHGYDISRGELSFGDGEPSAEKLPPEEITFMDPCMGSGNVLIYAFDVFMELYRRCGYTDKTAAESILRYNLFGLELDERACALAETALRRKAAVFGAEAEPMVYELSGADPVLGSLADSGDLIAKGGKSAVIGRLLQKKYTVIVTNPPYLGRPAMNKELSDHVRRRFADYGADLFSVFMARCMDMCADDGQLGFLAPATWLFLQSYEKLRLRIYSEYELQTLIHFEYSAFEDATVPLCTFTMGSPRKNTVGTYLRLAELKGDMEKQRQMVLSVLSGENMEYRFEADTEDFLTIPSAPAAYWLGRKLLRAFSGQTLGEIIHVREGLITGDNDRFLRRWYEVSSEKTASAAGEKKKWYWLNKGGDYRKWYGNRDYVVNWENDGYEIKNFRDCRGKLRSRPQGLAYNFRPSVSWSQITSGKLSVRFFDDSFMFNVAGTSAFPNDEKELLYILGLLNSKAVTELSAVLNPTMNMNPGDIARLPVPPRPGDMGEYEDLIRENVAICREDWDSFETSDGFERHPLI